MNVHCVGFVSCRLAELKGGVAFVAAAKFCRWDSTVVIRCDETGQDLTVCCTASIHGYSAQHFRNEWIRKHGML